MHRGVSISSLRDEESLERDGISNLKKRNFQDFNFLFFMTSSLFLKIGVNCFGSY